MSLDCLVTLLIFLMCNILCRAQALCKWQNDQKQIDNQFNFTIALMSEYDCLTDVFRLNRMHSEQKWEALRFPAGSAFLISLWLSLNYSGRACGNKLYPWLHLWQLGLNHQSCDRFFAELINDQMEAVYAQRATHGLGFKSASSGAEPS